MNSYEFLSKHFAALEMRSASESPTDYSVQESIFYQQVPEIRVSLFEAWERCVDEIANLASLESDWDGYGACPIGDLAVAAALRACGLFYASNLPVPEVSPKSAGTIGLSWDFPDSEAYIEIGNTKYSGYLVIENFEPALFSGEADEIFPELLYPLTGATPQFNAAWDTIAEIKISQETVYGFAA
ncbi:hypothetical protein [Burkholderia pseudomallei]|uniref:hypothetical protein n=1 Tax=Burkholderia pseudomallei TaxID=28450 RepID=UPI0012AEB864|nr:hypothetical protein [Burkholderia pseudomallei]